MPAKMLRSHSGHPDGFDVLLEMDRVLGLPDDEPMPLLLWSALRRVHAWAEAPPGKRAGLWGEGGSCLEELTAAKAGAPHLAAALDTFAELRNRPQEMNPTALADGCEQVGWWAAEWGLLRTGAMFMEAAAVVDPDDAVRAMHAANLCQRLGGPELMQRAEQWHQRAMDLALNAKRGRRLLSIRALLAYGNWARDNGDSGLSQKCYEKAARRAERYERWVYYAMAHHNMLSLVVKAHGELSMGQLHTQTALACYPAGHVRIPMLAHDYAVLLNRHGRFASSLQLLNAVLPLIEQSDFKLLALSSLAVASAGCGRTDEFENALRAALPLCLVYPDFTANALVHVAQGALRLGSRNRAQRFARRALRIASHRRDDDAAAEARKVLVLCREDRATAIHHEVAPHGEDGLVANLVAALPPGAARAATSGSTGSSTDHLAHERTSPNDLVPVHGRPLTPPPRWPLWGGAETISGLAVLEEADQAANLPNGHSLSYLLWRALRNVGRWAEATTDERVSLFSDLDGSIGEHLLFFRSQIPAVSDALGQLAAVYQAPELVCESAVADACDQIGRWAADRGLLRTAVYFMEAAATAEPGGALRAMHAAMMCQRLGGHGLTERAQEWHQRAFELARRARGSRRLLTIRALLSYGNWALAVADDDLARECFVKAARRARRSQRWPYLAMAHHNLLSIVVKAGSDLATGEHHTEVALQHYSLVHERLPMLAHDYSVLLYRNHLYVYAFRLIENLGPLFQQSHLRLLAYSSLAAIAAGAGKHDVHDQAVSVVLPLCSLHPDQAPYALVRLAEAAVLRRDYTSALGYAEAARDLGVERGDADVTTAACQLHTSIMQGEPPTPDAELPAHSKARSISNTLRTRLARLSAKRLRS